MSTARAQLTGEAGPNRRRAPVVAVVLTAVGVLAVGLVGRELAANGTDLHLIGGYVLRGRFKIVLTPGVLLPAAVAVAGVLWGPGLAARLTWPVLLPGAAAASALWSVALAVSTGWGRLTAPLAGRSEYPHDVDRVGDLGAFLATFAASVPADSPEPWTTHVAGHPPGALLAFVLLDRAGLEGLGWAAAACIGGGALAVPAVLVTVRAVADEAAARVVAPFAVLAPTALWVATSADALFAGVAAWGVALVATGAARTGTASAAGLALGAGVLLGTALFLSFGLAATALLILAVLAVQGRRRGWRAAGRVLVVAAAGVLLVVGAFALAGYWWLDGMAVTAQRIRSGPSYADRPLAFFLVANLAAAAVSAGPAAIAGLASLRRSALALLPLAAVAAMVVGDVTGLIRGETERIWLPFTVWLPVAAAFLPAGQRRWWLASSALLALAVEVGMRTEW